MRGDARRGRRDAGPDPLRARPARRHRRAGRGTDSSTAGKRSRSSSGPASLVDRPGVLGGRDELRDPRRVRRRPRRPGAGDGARRRGGRPAGRQLGGLGERHRPRVPGRPRRGHPQLRGGARALAGSAEHGHGARVARVRVARAGGARLRPSPGSRRRCGCYEQFRFRQPQAWFSAFLAEAHRRAHRLETALDLASQGLDLARATGSMPGIGWAERALGHVAQARGALADAQDHLREALRAFETVEARVRDRAHRTSIWPRSPARAATRARPPRTSRRRSATSGPSASPAGWSARKSAFGPGARPPERARPLARRPSGWRAVQCRP